MRRSFLKSKNPKLLMLLFFVRVTVIKDFTETMISLIVGTNIF